MNEMQQQIDKLREERDQARKVAELLRLQSWDDFYRTETAYDGDDHEITDEEAMMSECSFPWDGEAGR